ncbi:MAG: hypothetical protein VB858_08485, partial [Planctomycetaceae bacterium]
DHCVMSFRPEKPVWILSQQTAGDTFSEVILRVAPALNYSSARIPDSQPFIPTAPDAQTVVVCGVFENQTT